MGGGGGRARIALWFLALPNEDCRWGTGRLGKGFGLVVLTHVSLDLFKR